MNSRLLKVLAAATAVVLVVVATGVWWFFRGDPVAEVSLAAATESVDTADVDDAATDTNDTSDANGAAADLSGTWTVDTTTGDFDYESATGSFVGFRIEEELSGVGSTTAVGRTGDVAGSIVIDGTTVTDVTFDVDVTTITTEDSRRDDNVQDALDTGEFASASFVLTEPVELTDAALAGEAFAATGGGQLTVHGTTQDVDIDLDAQLIQDTIVVVGSTDITFSDYGVEVPDSQIVVSVEDFGVLELQLLLVR
ncbi:YceI family protein [Ilumatobacter sp.]|uniref:YceI family protein n=1 Tax=Ilumatobacter sp. TaxID=1967498 RepID=UPI003C6673A2